jgi:hypothetical protein
MSFFTPEDEQELQELKEYAAANGISLDEAKAEFAKVIKKIGDSTQKPLRRVFYWMGKLGLATRLDLENYLAAIHNTSGTELAEKGTSVANLLEADYQRGEADRIRHTAQGVAEPANSPVPASPAEQAHDEPPANDPDAVPCSALLSAADLAKRFGLSKNAVEVYLRRYRTEYPDCAVSTDGRRRNEPNYLYRLADVLPHLKAHFKLTDG